MSIKVGDLVAIVKVIDIENPERNAAKRAMIGSTFCVVEIEEYPTYLDQIYRLKNTHHRFHKDELWPVTTLMPTAVPQIGEHVNVIGSTEFQKVVGVKIMVSYMSADRYVVEGQYAEPFDKEEFHKRKRDLLTKKRAETHAKIVAAIQESTELNAEIARIGGGCADNSDETRAARKATIEAMDALEQAKQLGK